MKLRLKLPLTFAVVLFFVTCAAFFGLFSLDQSIGTYQTTVAQSNDTIGRISTKSNEQATNVTQVGESVTLMSYTTQQNAALVEEMAAGAALLKDQAKDLVHTVAIFKLS
jgi:methyl-accepting chemotaxis protein